MCIPTPAAIPPTPIIANAASLEASRAADIEARLRRSRAGAAANVLTSPLGLPVTGKLGQPA